MDGGVGHKAWAPEGREGRSQADPNSPVRYRMALVDILTLLKNIDIYKAILKNININIDKEILENIDTLKGTIKI